MTWRAAAVVPVGGARGGREDSGGRDGGEVVEGSGSNRKISAGRSGPVGHIAAAGPPK